MEQIFNILEREMIEPTPFGWFHLMWIFITIGLIIILFKIKNKSDKQLKIILGTYGVIALLLELLKQFIWSLDYNSGIATWDYNWYAFPFQLCTTPIFVSIICIFLKDGKIRKSLLSYLSFVTILGGFMTILLPDSCFVDEILINVHTMWLHCGSFVVSVYLLMSSHIEVKKENLKKSFIVFLIFVFIAQILNITLYNTDILNGETFNMFYISPYFISTLPIFNTIQQNVPYIIFLLIYVFVIFIGALIVYYISKLIIKLKSRLIK